MATITAQILVGHPNKLGNGMLPTHCLLLSQGTKPVWILKNLDILESQSSTHSTIRWIPTTENLLEDALLLISINILKDKELINKKLKYDYKLVITCFTGTALDIKLETIKEYSMDLEVCSPSYNRYYNPWINDTVIQGELL
jgi:hypothetical protein